MILSAYPFPGIPYTHDAGVCLLAPGQVLFASEEERHLRSMHAIGAFPERAAMSAFRQTGVRPEDIGCLVTTSMERCRRRSDYQARLRFAVEQLHLRSDVPSLCVPHHLAHSALAVLTSPFDECLFLTLDGGGDGHMGHWGVFRRGRFRVLESIRYSPAAFFSFVTSLCGFPLFEEGKAMGLAAYGHVDETLLAWFRKHFTIRPDSADLQTGLEMRWHSTLEPEHIDPDSYPRHKYYRWSLDFSDGSDRAWMHEIPPQDIARTGQQVFQELVDTIIGRLRVRTGIRLMACAGGAFLNVAANGHLVRRHPDMTFFYPVAPHDAGLALGAALWTGHTLRWPRPARPVSPLLGPSFTRKEIEGVLAEYGLDGVRLTNTVTAVARAVADGQIVGWFDGPAEYGARALGARSVLADPRRVESKARLNQLLKKRDWFMPYAPSILEERGAEYFEHFTPDPYMNVAIRVRPERAAEIPAAVHRDGTCRVHAVSKSLNPNFHAILVAFEDIPAAASSAVPACPRAKCSIQPNVVRPSARLSEQRTQRAPIPIQIHRLWNEPGSMPVSSCAVEENVRSSNSCRTSLNPPIRSNSSANTDIRTVSVENQGRRQYRPLSWASVRQVNRLRIELFVVDSGRDERRAVQRLGHRRHVVRRHDIIGIEKRSF